MEGEEVFDTATLGSCDEVVEQRVGDNEMLIFKVTLPTPCLLSLCCADLSHGASESTTFMVDRRH